MTLSGPYDEDQRYARRHFELDPKDNRFLPSPENGNKVGSDAEVVPALQAKTKKRKSNRPKGDASCDLPVIEISAGEVPRLIRETETLLLEAGVEIYTRAGFLVRPVVDSVPTSKGRTTTIASLRPFCQASLADHLSRVIRYRRYDARCEDWVDTNPPRDMIASMLVREGEWRLLPVAGIITTPTLRPDGTVLSQPGYDPATRLFLARDPTLKLPPLSDQPTWVEAEQALRLLEDLLVGFPFVKPVDKAVALSGILTAVIRSTLPVAPLHAIRAHSPGTGKSLLVDIASAIATGRQCPVIAAGKTEEETEKRLGALLLDGAPVISIDNVNGELGGDVLCQITERPIIRVRILGQSKAPDIECRSSVFSTGNNMVLIGDMTRRTVSCTLDAGVERPELREFNFDPVDWVLADRGAYVAAALTVILAYRSAGSPVVCGSIGSYNDWSATVRAPLIWLGHADPVASMETAREEDPVLSAIREFFEYWNDNLYLNSPYTINGIVQFACNKTTETDSFRMPDFRDLLLRVAGKGGNVNTADLGRWLKQISGRVVNGFKLETKIDPKRGNKYYLRKEANPPQNSNADGHLLEASGGIRGD